jgi:hypothetical protein
MGPVDQTKLGAKGRELRCLSQALNRDTHGCVSQSVATVVQR